MRHDDQVYAELQARWDSLTAHIAAVDRDLATELDTERKLTLTEKRTTLDDERRSVVDRMQILSTSRDIVIDAKNLPAASTVRGGRTVDYDELMRMIYEIRSDVAIMKGQFQDHLAKCNTDSAGFPPHVLTFLAVGGVVTLLLLAFIVVRIGMAG